MVLDSTMTKSLHPVEQSTYIPSQREHMSTLQCMLCLRQWNDVASMIIFVRGFLVVHTHAEDQRMHCMPNLSLAMDGELYLLWFEKVFLKYCSQDRPVILIQDWHKSHMTLSMIETARRENVILFNLPPHTTHVTQPLDESIFKPLKAAFGTTLKSVTFARQDYVLPKSDFPRVFCHPYNMTCTPFRINHFKMLAFVRLTHPSSNSICLGLQSISRHQGQMLLQLPMVINLSAHQHLRQW